MLMGFMVMGCLGKLSHQIMCMSCVIFVANFKQIPNFTKACNWNNIRYYWPLDYLSNEWKMFRLANARTDSITSDNINIWTEPIPKTLSSLHSVINAEWNAWNWKNYHCFHALPAVGVYSCWNLTWNRFRSDFIWFELVFYTFSAAKISANLMPKNAFRIYMSICRCIELHLNGLNC